MRTPVITGNWKMNLLRAEALALVSELTSLLEDSGGVEVIVCPPYTALAAVGEAVSESTIALGAQDCYSKEHGAFTGAVSPRMLRDAGCTWTIVGHSERRSLFGETDDLLNEKVLFARSAGLKVMFCVGETLEERESGGMQSVLTRQIFDGLKGMGAGEFLGLVVAYEPVWAIGTGVTASPEQAEESHAFVRGLIAEKFGGTVAGGLRIQYGGSVKPDNARELLAQPNVDGALVGGASLDAKSFAEIVKAAVRYGADSIRKQG